MFNEIYVQVSLYNWEWRSRFGIRKKQKRWKVKRVRKQPLPMDMMVDVLNCIDRITLDKRCQLASRRLCASVEKTQPLRPVDEAHFTYDAERRLFSIVFKFRRVWGDYRETNKVKSREFKRYSDAMDHFFNGLRWSYVLDDIRLYHLEIGTNFVDRLTAVGKDCIVKGHRLFVKDLTFKNDVSPLDFLTSLPKARALNSSTRALLETTDIAGGELLKAAASNGIWHICPNGNFDKAIADENICDFLFGAYQNGDCERKLGLKDPSVSDKFLLNLWQAARECQLKHMAYLKIESPEMFDMSAISKYGQDDGNYANGWNSKQICYDFPDLPGFRIVHWHHPLNEVVCWFNFHEEDMDCDDSLR